MKRLSPLWSLGVFLTAFAFYLATSAWCPYPGQSSTFVGALCFPGQLGCTVYHPIDGVALSVFNWLLGGMVGISLGAAFFGALTVLGVFRMAVAGVRWSMLDLTGIRSSEMRRVQNDLQLTSLMAGLGAAVMALAALPLWAQGTRPLAGGLSTTLGVALLAFSLGARWRCAADLENQMALTLRHRVLLGIVFALAVYVGVLSPILLPISLLGVVLGAWVLVQPEIDGRVGYLLWAAGGSVVGVVASIVTLWWWAAIFTTASGGAARLWLNWLVAVWPTIVPLFTHFEGASALVCFALTAALFLGCFPRAFRRFGSPIFGQIVVIGVLVLSLVRWPAEFWDGVAEPSPLVAVAIALLMVTVGMLAGSWMGNWLDVHTRWGARRAHTAASVALMAVLSAVAVGECLLWHEEGAGTSARKVCEELWKLGDRTVPQEASLWLAPDLNTAGFLVWRHLQGRPIYPVRNWDIALRDGKIAGKSFAECAQEDPLLARMQQVGHPALALYLAHSQRWRKQVIQGDLPAADPASLASLATDWLGSSAFGTTPIGRALARSILMRAARWEARNALSLPPIEAASHLRRAAVWAPENIGIALSVAALEQEQLSVSEEERFKAIQATERTPWLMAPTPDQARTFEAANGPVRTAAFRAANRMWRLLQDDRDRIIQELCARYQQNPAQLSDRERTIALLSLPEETVEALLRTGAPTLSELEVFLCAYPKTERSMALYTQYRDLLADNDALRQLYQPRRGTLATQQAERMQSFFSRDGHFAYALFYVNHLLEKGELSAAATFVSGFTLEERMAEKPCLIEYLRAKVMTALLAQDPADATETLRAWLRSNPNQPTLWTLLLQADAEQTSPALAQDVTDCLQVYPFHRLAATAFAETLRTDLGDAAAAAWLEAVERARQQSTN